MEILNKLKKIGIYLFIVGTSFLSGSNGNNVTINKVLDSYPIVYETFLKNKDKEKLEKQIPLLDMARDSLRNFKDPYNELRFARANLQSSINYYLLCNDSLSAVYGDNAGNIYNDYFNYVKILDEKSTLEDITQEEIFDIDNLITISDYYRKTSFGITANAYSNMGKFDKVRTYLDYLKKWGMEDNKKPEYLLKPIPNTLSYSDLRKKIREQGDYNKRSSR